jgi:hypothetical protein
MAGLGVANTFSAIASAGAVTAAGAAAAKCNHEDTKATKTLLLG